MLEIIALVYLWRVNGANARMKGKKALHYQLLTLGLWFGMEVIGCIAGFVIGSVFLSENYMLYLCYLFGIVGAVLGGSISYKVAKADSKNNLPPSENTLNIPATVHIREELGGYGVTKDTFYLNGNYIGALSPGMECILKTNCVKNIITIGMPCVDSEDSLHSVRFIAAENGKIEIHASEGGLIPELFKNES